MRAIHHRLPAPTRLLAAVTLAGLVLGFAGGIARTPRAVAAAPVATSEVNQTPVGGSTVAPGTHITYTVTVTLAVGQAQSMTIQLSGDSNVTARTLTCTSLAHGSANVTGPGGAPSCMWSGPVAADTYTFTFGGALIGNVGSVINATSVVCTDAVNTNTCSEKASSEKVALADHTGDVGPVTIISLAGITSEVNQIPAGGSTVAVATPISYSATVTVAAPMAQLTIQLRGDANIGTRNLVCTSTSSGNANIVSAAGTPTCKWTAASIGTFTFVFTGLLSGSIADAVPDAASVVCADTTLNNDCSDETAGNRVLLADATGDVGPVTVGVPPAATSEVNQIPPGGTIVAVGSHVTYSATVTLAGAQPLAFTIQLRGDPNITNRTLTCTSTTNGFAAVTTAAGTPSCRWNGPVAAGSFMMIFAGDVAGPIGSAVPDAASVACIDTNANNDCSDEPAASRVPLVDLTGDVGPLLLIAAPSIFSEVNQDPPSGSTVAIGAHLSYHVVVTVLAGQPQSMTIQLRGDNNLIHRTLTCTSTNGNPTTTVAAGNPSCMWAGPVAAGIYTLVLNADINGNIGDAVPNALSVVCTDTNSSNSCDDEAPTSLTPLSDANGDVGPVTVTTTFKIPIVMVAKDGV
jgi:hypothetical protein